MMAAAAVVGCGLLVAQTAINLGVQSRNVDFSAASFTKPVKTGPGLPGTCAMGEMFFRTDVAPGQNLYGCTSTNVWSLLVNGSGGGGAATAISQLTDFQVVRSSNTTLTINGSCSASAPCNYRYGSSVVRVTGPSSVVLAGTSGVVPVYLYISSTGNIVAGYSTGLSLNCSSCVVQSGISAFPPDSVPLYTWTAGSTSGQWDSAGVDYRALASTIEVRAGSGLAKATNPVTGSVTMSVDPISVGLRVSVPATASAPCSQGQWAVNATHVYFCAAANTWRRAALSSW
jgi:hypothetical protein